MSGVVTPLPIGSWEVNGWRVKTEQGEKASDDRKVWVASPGGDYCLLSLAALAVVARLWYVNEAILYYKPTHRGGEMVLDFVADVCRGMPLIEACAKYGLNPPEVARADDPSPTEAAA